MTSYYILNEIFQFCMFIDEYSLGFFIFWVVFYPVERKNRLEMNKKDKSTLTLRNCNPIKEYGRLSELIR